MSDTATTPIFVNGDETTLPELLRKMRLGIKLTEFTVSCGEKFQIRQYEGKDYHLSARFNMEALWSIFEHVADEQKPAVRNAIAQLLRAQIQASDDFQREIIRHLAQLDGCSAAIVDVNHRRAANAQAAGAKAATDGVPSTSNPYIGRSDAYGIQMSTSWNDGWQSVAGKSQ